MKFNEEYGLLNLDSVFIGGFLWGSMVVISEGKVEVSCKCTSGLSDTIVGFPSVKDE